MEKNKNKILIDKIATEIDYSGYREKISNKLVNKNKVRKQRMKILVKVYNKIVERKSKNIYINNNSNNKLREKIE